MKIDVSKSTEELLDRYIQLSTEQGKAAYVADTSKVNRIGDALFEISNEIKRRPDDRGQSILKLFANPNSQVRFNAATSVSGIFPHEARQVIQKIAESEFDLLSLHARMYLRSLDEGLENRKPV